MDETWLGLVLYRSTLRFDFIPSAKQYRNLYHELWKAY
jgi:hypothetical protein